MDRHNIWDYREGTFCTADLTPEERDRGYRQKITGLTEAQVLKPTTSGENGANYARNSSPGHWLKCDDILETDTDDTDSLWNVQSSNTGQTSYNAQSLISHYRPILFVPLVNMTAHRRELKIVSWNCNGISSKPMNWSCLSITTYQIN